MAVVTRKRPASDPQLLRILLGLHAVGDRILDATAAHGRVWRGLIPPYAPVRFDRRALPGVDVVGEWRQMADLFVPSSFDVILFDPPHMRHAGANGIVGGRGWGDRFGTLSPGLDDDELADGDSINHLFRPFLEASRSVLTPEGCLIAKIADQVHSGSKQLQHVDFINAARELGWTICECEPKPGSSTLTDPKWQRQLHLRSTTYWIVAHPCRKCPADGVRVVSTCEVCGLAFKPKRADAKFHPGGACRQKAYRRRQAGPASPVSSSA